MLQSKNVRKRQSKGFTITEETKDTDYQSDYTRTTDKVKDKKF